MSARPVWLINYEGRDVSDDIAPMVTSVTYTDHLHGKADELEISVEDGDGRWRELWYPAEGDRLDLKLGRKKFPLLPCGQFQVDEVELGHSARTATFRALSVPVTAPLRTPRSIAYEEATLRDVVEQVAARHGLSVVGEIDAAITFGRLTQAGETDLIFLRRLAESYGYAFNVRGGQLVFYPLLTLEAADPVLQLRRTDLLPGSRLSGSAQQTFVACEVSYLDPATGAPVVARVEADGLRRGTSFPVPSSSPVVVAPSVVLRLNSPHHEETRDWQRFLSGRSLYSAAIDGIFGTLTDRGTRQFQAEQGLVVDGDVGPLTYDAAIGQGFRPSSSATGGTSASGDVLRINRRVESAAEAEAIARSELHAANRLRCTGTFQLEGRETLVAGCTVDVLDYGRLSGRYMVDRSVHRIQRSSGYRTELEVSFVP